MNYRGRTSWKNTWEVSCRRQQIFLMFAKIATDRLAMPGKIAEKNRKNFIKLRYEMHERYMRTKTKHCRSTFGNQEEEVQNQQGPAGDRSRRSLDYHLTTHVTDVDLTDDDEGTWKRFLKENEVCEEPITSNAKKLPKFSINNIYLRWALSCC